MLTAFAYLLLGLRGPVPFCLLSVILPLFSCEGVDLGVLGLGVLGFEIVFAIMLHFRN